VAEELSFQLPISYHARKGTWKLAHNRLVGGSSPPGPTNIPYAGIRQ